MVDSICYMPDLSRGKECNFIQILSTGEERKRETICAAVPPLFKFAKDAKVEFFSLIPNATCGRSESVGAASASVSSASTFLPGSSHNPRLRMHLAPKCGFIIVNVDRYRSTDLE